METAGILDLVKLFGPMAGFGVLMWIMLREQLKSHKAALEMKDKQLLDTLERKDKESAKDRADFRGALDAVLAHCDDENSKLVDAVKAEFGALHTMVREKKQ